MNSGTSSSQSSPLSNNVKQHNSSHDASNDISSTVNDLSHMTLSSSSASTTVVVNGSGVTWKSGLESTGVGFDGGGGLSRQQVASFEEETAEGLEKQEIAYKLIGHVLDCVKIDNKLLELVRFIAKKQLQSLSAFLKVNAAAAAAVFTTTATTTLCVCERFLMYFR
jgi:phosphatidylinositol 4-kinase